MGNMIDSVYEVLLSAGKKGMTTEEISVILKKNPTSIHKKIMKLEKFYNIYRKKDNNSLRYRYSLIK